METGDGKRRFREKLMSSVVQSGNGGYGWALAGIALVTLVSTRIHSAFNDTTVSLAFLLVVLFAATFWGKGPALTASVAGMLCLHFFFLAPVQSLTITDPENWVALAAFVITALTAGHLSLRVKRRAAEAEAERSEARRAGAYNRSLIEASLDPLVTIGPDGKIADVNAAAEKATGRTRQELVGTDFSGYFTEPDKARAGYERAFRDGTVRDYALELRNRTGDSTPVVYNASVYRDENGAALGVFAAARDVTERKRAEADRQRAEEELLRIHRAQRALSSSNEALVRASEESALLQDVCRIIVEKAGYLFCWVGRAENDPARTVRPLAQAGFESGYLQAANISWDDTERGRGPTGTCIRTGQVQIAKNLATDPRLAPWRTDALDRGYASSVAIPLVVDSGIFGALTIYSSEIEAFHEEELKLLSELADDLGFGMTGLHVAAERRRAEEEVRRLNAELEQRVAIRTAELQAANAALQLARDREVEVGFRIQQTLLLDQPPSDMPGFAIAARTIPSQRIDGDFYIFIRHSKECLDVVIGDVMGKGIPAALLGAAAKNHFLKAASDLSAWPKLNAIPEPKDIVRLAHAQLVRQLIDLESFVTLCYARLNVGQARLDMVDCGHTGILRLCGQTGSCEILHGNNLPLGVRENEPYEQMPVRFEPGDLLFFFSDGITEARNPAGEVFGADRLIQCVASHRQLEPAALVEAVRQAVMGFSESDRLADDLTAVAVQAAGRALPVARAEIKIDSNLKRLHEARKFVRAFCRSLPGAGLDEEGQISLELAVDEAASNIMKHAYHGLADQPIQLEAEAFADRICIRLHHLGESFDPSSIPLPPLDGSRESGFGAYIISKTMDEVRYQQDEWGRNCIVLAKRRNTPGREEAG